MVIQALFVIAVLGGLASANAASLALHERAGLRVVATYRRHSKPDGEWRDCVIVEKLIGDGAAP